MLQRLNERVKGVVAWVVVILIAFTFTLFGIDYYLQSRVLSDSAMKVDGVKISKREFDLYYRRARQQIDPAAMTNEKDKALKEQIIQEIVNKQVALSAAEKNGFFIDSQQANAAILAVPQFQEDGQFSSARYQQALSVAMYTPESFQQEVRQGMLINQQRFAFMGTAFALPNEVNRFIKLYFQKRNYKYFVIPYKAFLKRQEVTKKDEKQYYQKHQKEFLNPEKVSIKYIILSLANERRAQEESITKQQVKAYYEENKQNYIEPAKWQVSRILIASNGDNDSKQKEKADKITEQAQKKPKQFDLLKKEHTDDKLSLSNENQIPWITAGQDDTAKQLMHLTKVGQVSEPIKTKYGYEIFQVKNYKPSTVIPFDKIKTLLRQQLVNSRAEKVFSEKLETLTDLTFQTPDSLEPASKAISVPVKETELFTRKGGQDTITKHKQVIQAAFSHDVLDLSNNSEQIQLDGDTVVFLRVKEHKPATEKPFNSVAKMINKKLRHQKAKQYVASLGKSFIDGKATFNELANKIKPTQLQWKSLTNITRESDKVSSTINNLAFSIQSINHLAGKELPQKGYLVVQLTAIHPGKKSIVDIEQRNSLKQQLESNLGVMSYDLYLNGLIKKAQIDKNI